MLSFSVDERILKAEIMFWWKAGGSFWSLHKNLKVATPPVTSKHLKVYWVQLGAHGAASKNLPQSLFDAPIPQIIYIVLRNIIKYPKIGLELTFSAWDFMPKKWCGSTSLFWILFWIYNSFSLLYFLCHLLSYFPVRVGLHY